MYSYLAEQGNCKQTKKFHAKSYHGMVVPVDALVKLYLIRTIAMTQGTIQRLWSTTRCCRRDLRKQTSWSPSKNKSVDILMMFFPLELFEKPSYVAYSLTQ